MRKSKGLVALAAGLSASVALTACGGSDSGGDGGTTGTTEGASGGSFSIQIGEPENPLVPGNTTESEGARVIDALWTSLVNYDPETSEVVYDAVAESIESEDQTTWTVTLKDGWTFHDGTPVNSDSFVDAWNYTALSTNAQGGSYFFGNVAGYEDLQGTTDDEGNETAPPAATEMSGLTVVDDLTFTVELTAPFAQYPVTVGYQAFAPLPTSFFEDPEAAGANPVGNGPFKADGEFVEGEGITLSRFEEYGGDTLASADSVEFRVYTETTTAYSDAEGGNLDIVPVVPTENLATAKDTFGDRYQERSSSSFTYLGFPTYDERYADKRVRQAFSMGIDRGQITEAIFLGSRTPATSVISPVVDGSREGACGYCELNVEEANSLLDEAGFDRSQPIELWFNSGAGHEQWVQAVGNQLQTNLGVTFQLRGDLDFSQYLPLQDEQGMTGPFRLGWSMDYPSPQNYLEPLYSTSAIPPAGSNATFYSNPDFDALVEEGNEAADNEAAIAAYQEAEDLLLEDMPVIPMFFGLQQSVHSENVSNIQIDAFGQVDVAAVTVNG